MPSHARVADCTGVLLAGGRATRLGGLAKGLLRLDGRTLVERALELCRELFEGALLVANDPAPYAGLGVPVVGDLLRGRGAPGGLHAALSTVRTGSIFLAACDMPHLSREGIRLLARERGASGGDAWAVAAEWGGRLEPLHALWARAGLPTVERMLGEGQPSMTSLARAVGVRTVPEAAWRCVDPAGLAFSNANTPQDLERLGLGAPST